MADLNSTNRNLIIKRHDHARLVALAMIQAREIRIMEVDEEIARNREDIEAQKKIVEEAERNIKQQRAEIDAATKNAEGK